MKRSFDRRCFLKGLAGTAAVLAAFSGAGAKESSLVKGEAGRRMAFSGARDYGWLIGTLEGFSATLVREHLALLKRYRYKLSEVDSQDRIVDLALADPVAGMWRGHSLSWVELNNAVRLHELYFDAMTPKGLHPGPRLGKALQESFGSFDQWWVKFRATAMAVRAWGVLVWDGRARRLVNCGLDRDSEWPLGLKPLLVVDMAEHAYVLDFIGRPMAYLDAWLARVNWSVVEDRLLSAQGDA